MKKDIDNMRTDEQYDKFVDRVRSGSGQISASGDFTQGVMDRIAEEQLQVADRSREHRGWRVLTAGVSSIAAALLLFGILSVSEPWSSGVRQMDGQPVVTAQDIPVLKPERRIEIYKQQRAVAELIAQRGR